MSSLRPGQAARLHDGPSEAAHLRVLRALGVTRRAEFSLQKAGEPCIIQVRATRIGVSGGVARKILVVPIDGNQPGR